MESQDSGGYATVKLQNFGPIADGAFDVKSLTLFTGRNGAGKTITSTLLYILQKCLWNAISANLRTISIRCLTIERNHPKQPFELQAEELNSFLQSPKFQNDLQEAFKDELSRAFTSQRNIVKHGRKKAVFQVDHSFGWSFTSTITASTTETKLTFEPIAINKGDKETGTTTGMIQRRLRSGLAKRFGGWHDRPIMIPAGRAGITDSYRYLAEQVLLERHGYGKGGPSGITRDFLATLVGSSQPPLFLEDDDEATKFVSDLFDSLLGGELRPSADPEELFTFDVSGHKIDRNVMSSMVKELGPMVVLLLQSQASGSILIVDEPECHLHPKAQIDLARAFVSLVAKSSRFILSTHSPYLAQSLSNAWVVESRRRNVQAGDMGVVNFVDSSKGISIRNADFHEEYGFTFDDFADTANQVQDSFVELFD